ncbi:hypothetical protein DTO169E5_1312 [Paecilomyces variotii]|nr:hypothetical protein DTO169E5_1312 [Paecilomyces variotii]
MPFRSDSRSRKPTRDTAEERDARFRSSSPDVSPTDRRQMSGLGNHRRALAVLDDATSSRPQGPSSDTSSINQEQVGWSSSPTIPPSAGPGTFFKEASEYEISPASPLFRPGTGRTVASDSGELGYDRDNRRPSVASQTTISSQGSRSSHSGGKFRKKLQGFFGDEFNVSADSDGNPQNHNSAASSARGRNNSVGSRNTSDRAASPPRPHTPLPSSEVTPWMYQRFHDIPQYGDAPVRPAPIDPDSHRFAGNQNSQKDSNRMHFPGHRHSRSKEERSTISGDSSRLITGNDDISIGSRSREGGRSASAATSSAGRATSPTPSLQSSLYRESDDPHSPGLPPNKRGFLDKLRRHKAPNTLKHLPGSSKSLLDPSKGSSKSKRDASPVRVGRQGSIEGPGPVRPDTADSDRRKDSAKGIGIGPAKFRGRRGASHETGAKEPRAQSDQEGFWTLDTDLDDMTGIISGPRPPSPRDKSSIHDATTSQGQDGKDRNSQLGNWYAPESWQVKRQDIAARIPETADDSRGPPVKDDGKSYFIRIFRIDSTFATLSSGLNTTVADILVMLGRKSFLQDDLNNYEIVLRKNDLSRQLDHSERPILMQKRLLEQVGYTPADRIEDIGREDHSYICRFTFLPTKLSGYSSLEGDPGFNKMQKFSHVDLQGRSLVTIPITLYKKASEIISLNLSRNLSMDVPKDFIQSCINLREIKFMSNEAKRLPPSIGLASRLTVLDISNNRLEDLEHAHLDRLQGLVSIKMANNKLTHLPSYFANFKSLRSLNMSSNSFQEIPEFLGNLKTLVDLDVSFNNIRKLPNIGNLTALERLWVNNNMLSGELDGSFKNLVNLKEVDARFNSIVNIDTLSQLPRLEQLLLGHNSISKFRGSFSKLRTLVVDHCPITQFDVDSPILTLTSLNIASAKLVHFNQSFFDNLPNLTKLILDRNHFMSLSPHIGKLRKLEHFSMIKNPLSSLPATIGCLVELKYLNLRECNLSRLPAEIWYCLKLETLNVSSNVLESFPRHTSQPPQPPGEQGIATPASTPGVSGTPSYEELGDLEDFSARRPSQSGGSHLNPGTSGTSVYRKGSTASSNFGGTRKVSSASTISRSATDATLSSRKDSNFSQRLATTFAGSLRNLYLADNRLEDDIFRELSLLPEIRILNLSYNELTELPLGILKRWQFLSELYLSGNELTSLPSDDLEETSNLKTLHINVNRFQVLPAELCKVSKLSILDVGSNALKYNVSNWPYDWNWNWNHNLKYLNFSGNKRLEIKPNVASVGTVANGAELTDFNSLPHLRVLGLMDVTLTIPTIPEETEDRRVRTSATHTGALAYGMADYLGRNEHLSIIDMMVPRLRPDNMETVVGMFDGQCPSSGGSKIAKFLHENFTSAFVDELKKLQIDNHETPLDALRRAFLSLNKDMAAAAYKSIDDREIRRYHRGSASAKLLNQDDINMGGVATILFLQNMDLYVANVGDAQAVLVKSDGSSRHLTRFHDPAESHERARIRAAGGFVSRNGKLNDVLPVSRAFGYFPMMPAVIAAPHTVRVTLSEQDEMIIVGSRELWDFVTPDVVVDVARAERRDLMIAAQKIRDLAISFGATNKLMVIILGVGELRKRERYKFRGTSMSMGPSSFLDESIVPSSKRSKKPRDGPGDSRLARFEHVDAPVGELAIIFTDIKKSTSLWETYPDAMRSAIQIHNDILRRQLGIIGGYEVKTEGDAFMVAFSTTTAALLWCFNCQTQLLEAEWPTEILEQPQCAERYDSDGNIIFRGLSVRMGIHWGEPVCEKDPVTNRMDYFGPMVNRASRISAVADGGQVFVSSDFMSDIQRNLEAYADSERSASTGSSESYVDPIGQNIRRELQQLNSQGFVIKDQGERKLKGLENPEPVYLIYPHSLAGRIAAIESTKPEEGDTPATIARSSQLELQTDLIWRLWEITLRLERLCSSLEDPVDTRLKEPNVALFNVVKNRGGELADSTVLSLVEQQVTRIEACVNTLSVRHMMRPFKPGDKLEDHAVPMGEIMRELQTQLAEFKALKEQLSVSTSSLPRPLANFVEAVTLPHSPSSGNSRASSVASLRNRILPSASPTQFSDAQNTDSTD